MLPTYQKHEVIYFQPGQLVFHVDGNSSPGSAHGLITWANNIAKKRYKDISISQRGESIDFKPPSSDDPDVQGWEKYRRAQDSNKDASLTKEPNFMIKEIRPADKRPQAFTLIFANVDGIKIQSDLLDLILLLDKKRGNAPGRNLQVVSPNWLASGSSEPGTVGGPGGRPVPYTTGIASTGEYSFTLPKSVPVNGKGQGVVVAILDTVPDESLSDIHDKWVKNRPGDEHALLKTMLDPINGRLTVHPDPDGNVDRAPLKDIQADGHDYAMTDHGLFVAGIIHSIAPDAELHLFQVLNRYGIGDLETIARALKQVHDKFLAKRLIVNLSLTLNLPLEEGHLSNNLGWQILSRGESECDSWICRKIRRFICRIFFGPSWFERQARPMEKICDNVYTLGSRVIAAAGNNYDEKRQIRRPQACYPAALESVVGVGALPKSKKPLLPSDSPTLASYSNLADRPPRDGITTFGGEEGAREGVLGIYVGEFPPSRSNPTPTSNHNGWGWWAGTSFATPIITGATALELSANPSFTTQEAIEALYAEQSIIAGDGQDVLDVTQ
jgi:hypothetical protein